MRKALLLLLIFISGCYTHSAKYWEEKRAAERADLVARFQRIYPDTWERELLKYDIAVSTARASQPVTLPPVITNVPPVNNTNNYWQEKAAEQKYYQSLTINP
jgi:hypothetical protein